MDHVELLAHGGLGAFENCQLLHADCSQAKRAMSAAQWFDRNWRAFIRTKRPPARQQVTIALQPELV